MISRPTIVLGRILKQHIVITSFRQLSYSSQVLCSKKEYSQADFDKRVQEQISEINTGDNFVSKTKSAHEPPIGASSLPHPIWSDDEVRSITITHRQPKGFIDWSAYLTVQFLRKGFDILSGYNRKRDEGVWINRITFLETVAGVPGMVAAMVRHLNSLRRMERDHGWIHTLLEEAENERMHLMTALQLKKPSWMFRAGVVGTQGFFVTFFSLAYLISPKYCHRFVGYLEEEAVVTYTKCLLDIENENGCLKHWKTTPAPKVAITYWKLKPTATLLDVTLAIRADEAHHRVVNHTLGSMKKTDYNPYKPGE
ncbi:DgyrCDS2371 [Dimorphilus gyrociliatus]|uniref:DgyrCDS2371 n=1 Tax=Dimorphilus gyrociliatus TaxID=2664684 RepID=A0A7I8VF78_9ANNE|nr:DgyrCDS2371 [Dimorphilus gyrociliatus]